MEINISIKGKNEFERIITIFQLGILTALECKLINIEESEAYLFNPYTLDMLKRNNINSNVIDITHLGSELEDIESLLPHKLQDNILELKKETINNFKQLKQPNLPIEKIIKEIIQ